MNSNGETGCGNSKDVVNIFRLVDRLVDNTRLRADYKGDLITDSIPGIIDIDVRHINYTEPNGSRRRRN